TQFLADVCRVPVEVAAERETTGLGAAMLAGLAVDRWSEPELEASRRVAAVREPELSDHEAETLHSGWRAALARTLL
ncbi:MAG: FGGY-family carbohydrate kinase, partial [Gaiellaceae bacterium]